MAALAGLAGLVGLAALAGLVGAAVFGVGALGVLGVPGALGFEACFGATGGAPVVAGLAVDDCAEGAGGFACAWGGDAAGGLAVDGVGSVGALGCP